MITKLVQVWTDGSAIGNPGPGGWAALLCYENRGKMVSGFAKQTTNNRMETEALIGALKALKRPCTIDLYTDSTYVINGVRRLQANSILQTNVDLWKTISALIGGHTINFRKVEAHTGVALNELVDDTARSCAKFQTDINYTMHNLEEDLLKPLGL